MPEPKIPTSQGSVERSGENEREYVVKVKWRDSIRDGGEETVIVKAISGSWAEFVGKQRAQDKLEKDGKTPKYNSELNIVVEACLDKEAEARIDEIRKVIMGDDVELRDLYVDAMEKLLAEHPAKG